MKIIEMHINRFGKLKDFTIRPAAGVNIIYGENESGKSTMMAFVKAMFYGLGSGEKRRQYEPWDGGQPEGSIEFEREGQTYLLTRLFGTTKAADKISLFNKSLGESVSLPAGEEPGTQMLGINVKTFVNTVFIGQAGTAVEGENHEIIARLTNMATAGDERVSKGEIEKRLKNAAAAVDSRKSTAILPELRKQKHELLETRMEIQKVLGESDELRDQIAAACRHRDTLTKEKKFLTDTSGRLAMQEELKEIDSIMAKHDELEALQEKYSGLDAFFTKTDGITELLEESERLMDEEKSKKVLLDERKKQLEEMKKNATSIDRGKLSLLKVIKKNSNEIVSAFTRYDSLINEKNEVELAMEQHESKADSNHDYFVAAIVCAAVVIASILLGVKAHWFFYIVGILAVISIVAYMLVYRKGVEVEGFSDDRTALNNINEDLRSLNSEMRPIFESFGVRSMEEFDREYRAVENAQKQYNAYGKRRDALKKEIDAIADELEDLRDQLRQKLKSYHETKSADEAYEIISRLGGMKQEYEKAGFALASAQDTYRFMLKERDYDELLARGEQLRGDINLEVPESFTEQKVRARLEETDKKLEEVSAQIIQQETALSLKPYSPQDLESVTDAVKTLTKRIEHYEFELSALDEAQATLNEAFREMQMDFGPMINYRAGRVLGGMTGEKYQSVFVSEKLVPSVAASGSSQPRSCDVLSAGTYDQIYLSLRLALSGVVSDEKLPIMLDDSLSRFDDSRMEQALAFIRKDTENGELGQMMIFTCHKRMLRAAKKLEMTDGVFGMEG